MLRIVLILLLMLAPLGGLTAAESGCGGAAAHGPSDMQPEGMTAADCSGEEAPCFHLLDLPLAGSGVAATGADGRELRADGVYPLRQRPLQRIDRPPNT